MNVDARRDTAVMVIKRADLIQVGQVLDKYELLERVGQGGMAVVYRGLDRALKRTVAVKILHKHLSDYQEARDRFEREAQAVAKLRHENILEIFDYKAGAESYIVTEFIDGQTLKQFITDRPIGFPEVGAMIMLQVARALAHAHAGGILHRDVKPENIMIRSDGVVKLMDFGISHMVDLERLTVTGQLLGSPAYMAPEHVEGRPLDFRTDVFAVGIVLYQLTVGKLPFEGKNPHEVLKRIAECKFLDPRQANPRIGNRLGRIILRAMAAAPTDRFPAIGEMVLALEAYLEESGIATDKITSELARYFKAPGPYEQALKERLVDHLSRRGQQLLADGEQAPALDVFDRVLTIDPKNEKVLAILDGLNRRTRLKQAGIAVLAMAAIGGGAYAIHVKSKLPPPDVPADPSAATSPFVEPSTSVVADDPAPLEQPAVDAGVVATAPAADARAASVPALDAGPVVEPPIAIDVKVNIKSGNQYRIDNGKWQSAEGDHFAVQVDQPVMVEVRNRCCQSESIRLDRTSKPEQMTLHFAPARLRPTCKAANASATYELDGKNRVATIDEAFLVTFDPNAIDSTKKVTITFTNGEKIDKQTVTAHAGEEQEVKCGL